MGLPASARDRAGAEAGLIERGQNQDKGALDKRTHDTQTYQPQGDVTLLEPGPSEPVDKGLPPTPQSPAGHATHDSSQIFDRPLHPTHKS